MAVTPMRSTTHLAQGLALGDVEQEDLRQAGLVLQESVLKGRRRERAATKEGAGVARQPTHHSPRRQLGEGGVGGGEDGEVAALQGVGKAWGEAPQGLRTRTGTCSRHGAADPPSCVAMGTSGAHRVRCGTRRARLVRALPLRRVGLVPRGATLLGCPSTPPLAPRAVTHQQP